MLACIENAEIALAIESRDYDLISLQIHPNTFPDRVIRYNKLEFYYMRSSLVSGPSCSCRISSKGFNPIANIWDRKRYMLFQDIRNNFCLEKDEHAYIMKIEAETNSQAQMGLVYSLESTFWGLRHRFSYY